MEGIPVPEPGPGEVLVEVKAAGVCLSDLHLVDGSITPVRLRSDMLTLGHEISGVIHALGPGLRRGLAVGTRVALQAGQPCRECATCVRGGRCASFRGRGVDYDGGRSQYMIAREDTVDPLPGARERALAFGADIALDPADPGLTGAVLRATDGLGLDHAFDFAGVPRVREQASPLLGDHGALVLMGITTEPLTISEKTTFNLKDKKVYGHYGSSFDHVHELIRLAGSGRLDLAPSITDHIPLAEAPEAIHRLERKTGNPIRLVLVP
ncbi:alcohol dehydrogenase catalytic domain-containing protein [Streptomyces sp. NPDC006655]|uniref:alcohol dehydrogenase catalytic domain-containing protein n=1 Tax=Streptomyces sp. NPDC006655 TaxID=3156898 RepID=UPI003454693B